jgi:hypothetical protein
MGKVYFGNETKQTWIKAPSTGMKGDAKNWSKESQLLNGRAFVRRSKASHRRFDMSWLGEMNDSDIEQNLNTIKDFHDGIYGDGPFYWNDPYAVDSNILPPHWAVPMLAESQWPEIVPGLVQYFVPETLGKNFPSKYIEFDTTNNYESEEKLTLIIPKDYALNFGWHGPADGASTGIRIVPYLRSTGEAATAINPAKITAGGSIRTNTRIAGDTYSHVKIFVATTTATTGVKITGMIAQILPEAAAVATGDFITGRGTTGLEFAAAPQMEYYSSAIGNGRIGMSTSLVEV